jgi:hypothetical protein
MKQAAIIVSFSWILMTASQADDAANQAANWRECDALAAEIMSKTGAEYVRTSEMMHNVFMKHPSTSDLMLECGIGEMMAASASWESAFPPSSFFETLADAGSVVAKAEQNAILGAVHKCHRDALKSDGEMGEVNIRGAHVECQAFTRDGGATTISVWRN